MQMRIKRKLEVVSVNDETGAVFLSDLSDPSRFAEFEIKLDPSQAKLLNVKDKFTVIVKRNVWPSIFCWHNWTPWLAQRIYCDKWVKYAYCLKCGKEKQKLVYKNQNK
jgi:hypothetical protein